MVLSFLNSFALASVQIVVFKGIKAEDPEDGLEISLGSFSSDKLVQKSVGECLDGPPLKTDLATFITFITGTPKQGFDTVLIDFIGTENATCNAFSYQALEASDPCQLSNSV